MLRILNDLPIKHSIKLTLNEKGCKTSEKSSIGWFMIMILMCEVFFIDSRTEYIKKSYGMLYLFFYRKFDIKMLLMWKVKKFNESCSLSKATRMSSAYLKWNLGLLRLYSFNQLNLLKPMKILARIGTKGRFYSFFLHVYYVNFASYETLRIKTWV